MVLQYQERCMNEDGLRFCRDLKIVGNKIVENWRRKEGHRVDKEDITDILAEEPEVLVIGTGYAGFMEVSKSLHSALKKRNIRLISGKTQDAVKTFNQLHSEGKRVAGAFHLTC